MKGAVCKRIYDKVVAENEELKKYVKEVKIHLAFEEDMEELKRENEKLKKENKSLSDFRSEAIDAMKYDDDLDDEDIISGIRDMEEEIIGECELQEQIRDLKEENNNLKEENETLKWKLHDTTCWDEFEEAHKKLKQENEKLKKENESLKKSNKQKTKIIHKFREQVKGLDKVMLSSAFQSWREVQCATNPQYTIQDEIDFLNGETTNQELINEVFEDLYAGEYEYDMKNKTYTEIEEEEEVQGSKVDMEAFTKLKENGMMPWVKDE